MAGGQDQTQVSWCPGQRLFGHLGTYRPPVPCLALSWVGAREKGHSHTHEGPPSG